MENDDIEPQTFKGIDGDFPASKRELEQQILEAWDSLVERWDSVFLRYLNMDTSTARAKWIVPLLEALGFEPVYNKQAVAVGERLSFQLSHRGWNDKKSPEINCVAPSQDLDQPIMSGTKTRSKSPQDELQNYLNVTKDYKWGIATNGVMFRILRQFYHTTTKGYIEFDIENIFIDRSFSDFRLLYRLAHSSRFITNQEGRCILENFYDESRVAGIRVGQDLRRNVKSAIESLGNGFLTPALTRDLLSNEELCRSYYSELLRIVYRVIFLLFAEQRGMLPTRNSIYSDEYSINKLREIAESVGGRDEHADLWEGLKVTFNMLKHGCPELKVFAYNGTLFEETEIPVLSTLTCKNVDLLYAVSQLTSVEQEHVRNRINYLDLGVEEIGSIYESLLEYTPRISIREEEVEGELIPANRFYLDPRGTTRKTTGSYYTDHRLIDELVKSALKPVVEDRLARSPAEKNLLSLKICDPACGSGAFLIAANNFLARELAKVRTREAEPPEKELRKARRDILQHCIYGVDHNPMAVELAKVSLWINASVDDVPLNFLDHHIKCGNSLIGASPELIKGGVPAEAFSPVTGDDPEVSKRIVQINKESRGTTRLDEFIIRIEREIATTFDNLSEANESAVEGVEAKRRMYAGLVGSAKYSEQKRLADAWVAAFFWKFVKESPPPPTTAMIESIARAGSDGIDSRTLAEIERLSSEYKFFHWYMEFPDVFGSEQGGFDCILGNPPWERLKLQEREFFAAYDREIADAHTAAIRNKMIQKLKETRPSIFNLYRESLRVDETSNKFVRLSGRFPFSGTGDVNTYALFAELATSIIGAHGRSGLVVKTGIISDDTTKALFNYLVSNRRLVSLYDFSNKKGIFPAVIPNERFCLLTCAGPGSGPVDFEMSLLSEDFDDLAKEDRRYRMTAQDIALMNPNTRTCPMFQFPADLEICRRIYAANSIMIREEGTRQTNPWELEYFTMFHMTNDSGLFRDKEWLDEHGYVEQGNRFENGTDLFLPLYEAKLFNLFDHRHGTFEGVPRERRFGIKAEAKDPTLEQKQDIEYEVEPRYWVNSKSVWESYEEKDIPKDVVFLFRNTCRTYTDSRTARGTLVPASAASNGCPLLIFRSHEQTERVRRMTEFACLFSSLVFDYLVRQKMSSGNLNRFILIQIAVPPPQLFLRRFRVEGVTKTAAEWITEKSAPLFFTTTSFESFFAHLNMDQPHIWDPTERFESQCFIDALIAKLYGLSKVDFHYILTRFPVLQGQEIREFGEYRTLNSCMAYFDRIEVI